MIVLSERHLQQHQEKNCKLHNIIQLILNVQLRVTWRWHGMTSSARQSQTLKTPRVKSKNSLKLSLVRRKQLSPEARWTIWKASPVFRDDPTIILSTSLLQPAVTRLLIPERSHESPSRSAIAALTVSPLNHPSVPSVPLIFKAFLFSLSHPPVAGSRDSAR